jgi:quinohemoprotein amine dehydrogenase
MLRSILDGRTVVRSGHGIIYGGYAWRGLSKGSTAASTPDGPSNDAREVTTSTPDESSADGRWFWGQYQELGLDIHIQRASTDATLLAIDRLSVKTGSLSQRIRLFGDRFPTQVLLSDINLGPGVAVRRIVSHSPQEIVADIDVARNAPIGKHKVSFGRSVLAGPLALYDRVDYIKVNPESATAAFGEPTRSRGYQQFEAIGYQNGPDGKRHTDDDVELGPVDATWSMKIFYESEDARTDLVGSVSPSGFFTPALDSPQNNFDVWVVAEAKTDRDQDGQPLVGKAYLVITVPFYVFNGRRYVRDLDHWVDDGPAMPAPRENR